MGIFTESFYSTRNIRFERIFFMQISTGERRFVRACMERGGVVEERGEAVVLPGEVPQAEFFRRVSKHGTEIEFSMRIYLAAEEKGLPLIHGSWQGALSLQFASLLNKNISMYIDLVPISDNGSVNELVFWCLNEAMKRFSLPDFSSTFEKRNVSGEIFMGGSGAGMDLRCRTYGVTGSHWVESPLRIEELASECVLSVVDVRARDVAHRWVSVDSGSLPVPILQNILSESSRGK
jgi:hypothetical protein